ncbi:MAG: site-specific integrase [Proteobacteria bacterium]|nr:site-specific integrase [Pseudomonadota bacterium]
MAQAKTLSDKELKIAIAIAAQGRYAARDRAMLLMSYWSGMRVGEIAALHIGDVINADRSIKDEIRLTADQTKGNKGRTVLLGDRLRRELSVYVDSLKCLDPDRPFFYSQRQRSGFNANTLCQQFGRLYGRAGLDGATSHSGRRTFITTLANKGVGVRVLMALAGHQNMSTTQRYIDLNDEMMKSAVNLL